MGGAPPNSTYRVVYTQTKTCNGLLFTVFVKKWLELCMVLLLNITEFY